jgi:hypothetical protein
MRCSETIRPYACGHAQCWPLGASAGIACFRTSGELGVHRKTMHPGEEEESGKPYRCALPDCGRSWKVMILLYGIRSIHYGIESQWPAISSSDVSLLLSQLISI